MLYSFYESVADSLGSLASFASRYSDCVVLDTIESLLSGRKLDIGTVILSDVRNICKRRNRLKCIPKFLILLDVLASRDL